MNLLKPGETIVASEQDISAGNIGQGVNDAYDLYLVKLSSGDYKLIVFMKLQFFFEDSGPNIWTLTEKTTFVNNWKTAISNTWGNRKIKSLGTGKSVFLDFRFQTQIAGWMFDHWEITVKKIPKNSFSQSYVMPSYGNVTLDSEDLTLILKGSGAGQKQRGVVHEFGHMLGMRDEYHSTSPHTGDRTSVMNRGEVIRSRHDSTYLTWLNNTLKTKGIK